MSAHTKRGRGSKSARSNAGGRASGPKPAVSSQATGGGRSGSTPVASGKVKFSQWCSDVCQLSDGSGTLAGMGALGPVASFGDLLLPSPGATPQMTLAAEQLVHLIEGWRYAASAVGALLSHANGQALHLAYYAELRAAMSLFAWSGIRVKRDDYFYLNANGQKVSLKPQRTHEAVWGLWQKWVQRSDAKSLFNDQIKLHPSVTLGDVIGSVRYVNASATFASWGLDLWDATQDHFARNSVSYEALLAEKPLTQMVKADAEIVLDLWKLFLSDGSSLSFDAALINFIVADSVPKLIAQSQMPVPPTYEEQLGDVAVSIAAMTGVNEDEVLRRLDRSAYPSRPFTLASARSTDVANVVCRGFFLLRMAMLAAKNSLRIVPQSAAKQWMENWLSHAGILSPTANVDLIDLEEDYRLAVDDFEFSPPFPESFWIGTNMARSTRLTRPDACIAWGLVA